MSSTSLVKGFATHRHHNGPPAVLPFISFSSTDQAVNILVPLLEDLHNNGLSGKFWHATEGREPPW
eukprot:CAMPEP_0196652208 /NCGR_PEP_ID=MMETSP1086-20130531/1445_1 /TAXON_ID=77921 /ORGANISM="Cyanoptyche  gloeocystis , Strain SAG4.97" /LENGTH=65 /DNA_ID=CAMNT_0041982629 /DNA_START=33 /DNA_END=230 /DNA_ORIENTATION=-